MNYLMFKYGLMLCLAAFWYSTSSGQFTGGDGDGNDKSGVVQMTLKGIQINSAPLYQGGIADGSDKQIHASTLAGNALSLLNSGGTGDGHSKAAFQGVIDGTDLAAFYSGGISDGHSKSAHQGVIDGTSLVTLYSGGDGDGHNKDLFNGVIDGTDLIALFSGGSGDGHDKLLFNGILDGTMLASLYSGGIGDGHDKYQFQGIVDGTSLASMYSGGIGDGHDKSFFSGILTVPLPVELIIFDAYTEQRHVVAFWITAVEIDNDYFSVQRTKDFNQIESIGDVPTQGNQNSPQEYSFIDPAPYQGTSYYRLKITALDNEIDFSDWVAVKFEMPDDFGSVSLFPNPVSRETVFLEIEDLQPDWDVHVRITTIDGKIIFEQKNLDLSGNTNRFELHIGRDLAEGIYVVNIYGDYSKSLLLMKAK